jgi:serine phosphatase RsbU (regulator of sigma subunit)
MSSVLSLVEDLTERKATEEVLRETARLDETLTAIDALMHSSLRAGQAVETALREGAEALGAQVGLVTTHAAEGFRIDYLHGGSAEGLGRIVPDEADALGLSVLTGRETLAIGDVGTEARADQWLVQDFHVRSIIVAPLIRGGEATGCLYFAFLEEVHSFSAAEVQFVNRLASSLSLAMENAALYEAQRNIALTLQQAFIHPLPDLDDLEVGIVGLAAWQPALVGGDFWDVFHLRDDKVLIVIGDVSGKGVEAAALTETVHSAVRAFASVDDSPGFILSKTNDLLLADPKIETFVTALVLVLSIGTGKVSLASAGHPGPLRVAEGSCETVDPEYRLPLGIFTTQYPTRELQLGEGEYLALYTDGVTEARSAGELFGEERVKEALRPLWGRPSQDLAAALAGAASSFADSLTDDLQVLVIRRR